MKIGLIHNLYGKYSRGGAETVVKMMAENFQKSGHQVFIITTRPKKVESIGTADKTEAFGRADVFYLNSEFYNLNKHSLFYRALWQIGNIFSFGKANKIKKILNSEKPDLVITHNLTGPGFMIPAVLKKLQIRHEHFLHDIQLIHPSGLMIFGQEQKIDSRGARIYQALTRALFGSPAKIISPSNWLLEIHRQRKFFNNSEYELRPFVWPRAENHIETKKGPAKNFLFIGQIEEQKGIFLLINAFKKIKRPELTLTVAIRGGGEALERAKKEAESDKRIKFLGPLSYEETEKIKKESDCLIVPSLCYENSPTTIYGAHAAGLPVVASRLGGIPELMKKNDLLFTPGDENSLVEKILAMAG